MLLPRLGHEDEHFRTPDPRRNADRSRTPASTHYLRDPMKPTPRAVTGGTGGQERSPTTSAAASAERTRARDPGVGRGCARRRAAAWTSSDAVHPLSLVVITCGTASERGEQRCDARADRRRTMHLDCTVRERPTRRAARARAAHRRARGARPRPDRAPPPPRGRAPGTPRRDPAVMNQHELGELATRGPRARRPHQLHGLREPRRIDERRCLVWNLAGSVIVRHDPV